LITEIRNKVHRETLNLETFGKAVWNCSVDLYCALYAVLLNALTALNSFFQAAETTRTGGGQDLTCGVTKTDSESSHVVGSFRDVVGTVQPVSVSITHGQRLARVMAPG
jgi:hypothetical protein